MKYASGKDEFSDDNHKSSNIGFHSYESDSDYVEFKYDSDFDIGFELESDIEGFLF